MKTEEMKKLYNEAMIPQNMKGYILKKDLNEAMNKLGIKATGTREQMIATLRTTIESAETKPVQKVTFADVMLEYGIVLFNKYSRFGGIVSEDDLFAEAKSYVYKVSYKKAKEIKAEKGDSRMGLAVRMTDAMIKNYMVPHKNHMWLFNPRFVIGLFHGKEAVYAARTKIGYNNTYSHFTVASKKDNDFIATPVNEDGIADLKWENTVFVAPYASWKGNAEKKTEKKEEKTNEK